jgi:hypothetical protein
VEGGSGPGSKLSLCPSERLSSWPCLGPPASAVPPGDCRGAVSRRPQDTASAERLRPQRPASFRAPSPSVARACRTHESEDGLSLPAKTAWAPTNNTFPGRSRLGMDPGRAALLYLPRFWFCTCDAPSEICTSPRACGRGFPCSQWRARMPMGRGFRSRPGPAPPRPAPRTQKQGFKQQGG